MKNKLKKTKDENKYGYKIFIKDYKWLHIVLICIMALIIISTFIMIVVFSNCFENFELLMDFGGWTSLISGLLVFIGSTFLALVVFYNTWQRQKKEDELNELSIKATARFFAIEENIIIPYTKEQVEKHCKELGAWGNRGSSSVLKEENISYTQIKIQNMQFKYPMYFEYIDAYCLNEEKETLEKIPTKFKTTHSFQTPIEYREQTWCYVGVFNKDISKVNKINQNRHFLCLRVSIFRLYIDEIDFIRKIW